MQDTEDKMQDTGCQIQDKKHKTWGIMHRASCIGHHGKKGFTMIELVITMVLIGIVAYIAADAMSTGFKAFFVTDNRKEALDQSRIAMERMTREIRNVRNNQSVCNATAINFNFYDIDNKQIEFNLSSPYIQRRENAGTWNNLANGNPITLAITYYDTNGNVLGAPAVGCSPPTTTNIKRIQISITVTVSGENIALQSEVWPRNL